MYSQILQEMQEAVKAGRIRFRLHALDELADEGLLPADAINCILTGEIMEQQVDEGEEKYLLYGDARNNDEIAVVAKLGYNQTTVIITVFRLRVINYDF